MPTLKLRFPGGRYHATPWGHHVNEGLVEWPPSPWRLLRALIACGFSSQGWTDVPPPARRLIEKLAGVLPSYHLPDASMAHSRHYMPVGVLSKGREQTTLVFDTWADVGDGEMLIHWPCLLDDQEAALFSQLAAALGYLGRSESWVVAEMVDGVDGEDCEFNAFPHAEGMSAGPSHEQVSLMAAVPADEYAAWYGETTAAALTDFSLPEGKKKPPAKLLKARENAVAPYPADLLSCLMKDTAWWKSQHGWSQPPGSQQVIYWRRRDALQVGPPPCRKPGVVRPVTTMLLALTTSSGNRSALPPCSRTLPQAELLHRAIVGRVANGHRVHCPELTGRDDQRRPLQADHSHAHILPVHLSENGDGRIDHIIIYAPMGLGGTSQHAIRTLRRTWTKGGVGDLQMAVVGAGDIEMLRNLPSPWRRRVEELLGPAEGALVWESLTPYIPPRFLKARGENSLLGQVRAELASRQRVAIDQAERVGLEVLDDLTRALRHYVRRRNHGGGPPPVNMGYGLRLTFAEPVHGPLMLGYASHFGLGMFRASVENRKEGRE